MGATQVDDAQRHRAVNVRQVDDEAYELRCSVCTKTAMRIVAGTVPPDRTPGVIVRGLTGETGFPDDDPTELLEHLEQGALAAAHVYVAAAVGGGLDAYCPDCDEIFCADHYQTEQSFDDGFYDCTYGTCPEGHRRMLAD
jgi:hypothetical protein